MKWKKIIKIEEINNSSYTIVCTLKQESDGWWVSQQNKSVTKVMRSKNVYFLNRIRSKA